MINTVRFHVEKLICLKKTGRANQVRTLFKSGFNQRVYGRTMCVVDKHFLTKSSTDGVIVHCTMYMVRREILNTSFTYIKVFRFSHRIVYVHVKLHPVLLLSLSLTYIMYINRLSSFQEKRSNHKQNIRQTCPNTFPGLIQTQ